MKRLTYFSKTSRILISKLLILFLFSLSVFGCAYGDNKVRTDITPIKIAPDAININSASAADFERLPNIGPKISRKIVAHRTKFGKFRRVENILLVDGISETRFRKMRSLIKIE